MSKKKKSLFEIVEFEGRRYITSHQFHEQVKATESISATNKAIRNAETYDELSSEGHILEIGRDVVKRGDSKLDFLIKANSYNPVMLIDPVAQKALEHHFKVTSTQAVTSSKENAMLGLIGVDLSVIAENKEALQAVKQIHDAQRDGLPLPIAKAKKAPLLKRLDEAVGAAKKLKELTKIINVGDTSGILKVINEECDLDLRPLANTRYLKKTTISPKQPALLEPTEQSETQWVNPTSLGVYIGIENKSGKISPQKINLMLAHAGLQKKVGRFWEATTEGAKLSRVKAGTFTKDEETRITPQLLWDKDQVYQILSPRM